VPSGPCWCRSLTSDSCAELGQAAAREFITNKIGFLSCKLKSVGGSVHQTMFSWSFDKNPTSHPTSWLIRLIRLNLEVSRRIPTSSGESSSFPAGWYRKFVNFLVTTPWVTTSVYLTYVYMSRDPHTPPQPDGSPPPVAGEGGFSQQPSRLLLEVCVVCIYIYIYKHIYIICKI